MDPSPQNLINQNDNIHESQPLPPEQPPTTATTTTQSLSIVSEEDRKILRDKLKETFARIITDIDKQVLTVSESQYELDSQLDRLISTLDSIKIDEKLTDEIKANAKRISSLKDRLTLVHTILSNSSARCSRTLAACGAAVSSLNQTNSPLSSHQQVSPSATSCEQQ